MPLKKYPIYSPIIDTTIALKILYSDIDYFSNFYIYQKVFIFPVSFFLSNDTVKSLSIVKNNGKVEVLTKSEKYDKMQLMNSFKRCYKKHVKTYSDSEINKAVSAFLSQNEEMIEWIQSP